MYPDRLGASSSSETVQPPADEVRLADLVTPSPEVSDSVRPKLWAIAQEAARSAVTEHDRGAIYLAMQTLDWQVSSRPGDPLPDGLVLSKHSGDTVINRDTRRGVDANCISAAYSRFNELGMGEVLQEVWSDVATRKQETLAQLRRMVISNPSYSILQSFDVSLPDTSERPLSPFFRTVRESQIRQEVRDRHALLADEPIEPHSEADFALRRSVWQLDDEAMSDIVATQDDAYTRAKKYFASLMAEQYIAYNTRSSVTQQELAASLLEAEDPNADHELLCSGLDAYLFDEHYARQVIGEGGTACQRAIADYITTAFVHRLFDKNNMLTYEELLGEVVREVTQDLEVWLDDGESIGYELGSSRNLSDFLRYGGGEFVDESILQANALGYGHNHGRIYGTGYVTRQDFERTRQRVVGHIEAGNVDTMRSLQTLPKSPLSSLDAVKAELVVSLTSMEFERLNPHLLGYRLVGRSGDRFGFIREATDPYAKAYIPIPPDHRERLAEFYARIKLTDLANAVRRPSQLTVESLRVLIQANSHYHLPEKATYAGSDFEDTPLEKESDFPVNFAAESLEAFKPFVRDNKLYTQCSGAGTFLKLSLQEIFGKHAAYNIDGYYVSPAVAIINGVKHRQTVFENEGRVYILDATPFSSAMPGLEPRGFRFSKFLRGKMIHQPPAGQQLPVPNKAMSELTVEQLDPETNRAQQIMALRRLFESHLQVILGVQNAEDLYETVTKLPEDADPLRRTAEVVLRASYNEDVSSEVKALAGYLALYRETSEDVRRQMHVASYKGHVIESLEQVTENLAQYL